MSSLLDDILDFGSSGSGASMRMQAAPFRVREQLLRPVRRLLKLGSEAASARHAAGFAAKMRALQLRFEVEADVPDSCTGDVLRLSQVTTNLLTNVRSLASSLRPRDGLSRELNTQRCCVPCVCAGHQVHARGRHGDAARGAAARRGATAVPAAGAVRDRLERCTPCSSRSRKRRRARARASAARAWGWPCASALLTRWEAS
jgi:hypothetical protein